MSRLHPPLPAKLLIGLFSRHFRLFQSIFERMKDLFGPIDLISPWFEFNWTQYYEAEMGSGLWRRMAAFGPLISQNQLPDIKLQTNAIETGFTDGQNRRVNIDPGYLLPERFVLATGKNYTHRIYLDKNIYADLTLIYQKGGFQTLPWTYPDYAQKNIQAFLTRVRNKYLRDLKSDGYL